MTLKEFAKIWGIAYKTLWARMERRSLSDSLFFQKAPVDRLARGRVDKMSCVVCGDSYLLPKCKKGAYITCVKHRDWQRQDDGIARSTDISSGERIIVERRKEKCQSCGDLFMPRTTQLMAGCGKFCSQKCNGRSRKLSDDDRRAKNRYQCAARNARKNNAIPKWLKPFERKQILDIYAACPDGWQVDHVVPLRGELVCGLHVPWNLRAIPARLNSMKNNKLFSFMLDDESRSDGDLPWLREYFQEISALYESGKLRVG